MPTIKVNTGKIESYKGDLEDILKKVNSIKNEFVSISGNLEWDIKAESNINSRVSAINNELIAEANGISGMANFLDTAKRTYENLEIQNGAEKSLWDDVIDVGKEIASGIVEAIWKYKALGILVAPATATTAIWIENLSIMNKWVGGFSIKTENGNETTTTSIKPQFFNLEKEIFSDKKDKQLYKYDSDKNVSRNKKVANIFGIEGSKKKEASLYSESIGGKTKYRQGTVTGKIGTGEVHSTVDAGFFIYEKDSNGKTKRVFSPGMNVDVGASGALLDIESEGRIGFGKDNNMLGVYGKSDIEFLSGSAGVKAVLDHGEAYMGAELEANLVKVEATGGVSILGTDLGVTGAFKIGLGAHAEAGYTDGVFKVDVGAAVGIGADIAFEVDVQGTVEAVSGWAESLLDNMGFGNFSDSGGGGGGAMGGR